VANTNSSDAKNSELAQVIHLRSDVSGGKNSPSQSDDFRKRAAPANHQFLKCKVIETL
jgi:hypothetical protein